MSAETLRRAAALMRERADLPYVGGSCRWEARGRYIVKTSGTSRIAYPSHAEAAISLLNPDDSLIASEAAAEHIASWHPAVALAVAALLDAQAKFMEDGGDFSDIEGGGDANALAIARAYLGERS